MKRIESVKKEEKMSHSYENNTTVIAASLADLARELIEQKNIRSCSEATKFCSEAIQNDELFLQLFPTIFNIELMKYRINNRSNN